MALKKRLTNFISNWLGVIIAVIIVAISATFGGIYLYGRSRLDNTLAVVTQAIFLPYRTGFAQTSINENPPSYSYHITLQDYNLYNDTIDLVVSDITVDIGSHDFTLAQAGSWQKSLPNGFVTFEGDITIDKATFTDLVNQSPVALTIKGNVSASGEYRWIKRSISREFTVSVPSLDFKFT